MLVSVDLYHFSQMTFRRLSRSRVGGEFVSAVGMMPILAHHPPAVFVGMPVFAPAQEAVPHGPFHLCVGPGRRDVAVIKGPAPRNGVELPDQVRLCVSALAAADRSSYWANPSRHLFPFIKFFNVDHGFFD